MNFITSNFVASNRFIFRRIITIGETNIFAELAIELHSHQIGCPCSNTTVDIPRVDPRTILIDLHCAQVKIKVPSQHFKINPGTQKRVLRTVEVDNRIGQVSRGNGSEPVTASCCINRDRGVEFKAVDFNVLNINLHRQSVQLKQNFASVDVTQDIAKIIVEVVFELVKVSSSLLIIDQCFAIVVPLGESNDWGIKLKSPAQLPIVGPQPKRIVSYVTNLAGKDQVDLRLQLIGNKLNVSPLINQ